jgi:hypothetical protein
MVDIQIPDEAVEAAARAAHELWRQQASVGDDIAEYLTWDDIESDDERVEYLEQARAAIRAALAAWPGADVQLGAQVTKKWRDPGKIILPLPQEKSNG